VKLFGTKEKQAIEIIVDPCQAKPGDSISALVHIAGLPDDKARGVVGELVARHHWASESTVGDWTDPDREVVVTWHNDVLVAAQSELLAEGHALAEGDYVLNFTVPEDAIPSTPDAVSWAVRLVVHHRLASHVTEGPLEVVSEVNPNAGVATSPPTLAHNPSFRVDVDQRDLHPGDKVTGTVLVDPASDLHLKSLSVALELERTDFGGLNLSAGGRHTEIKRSSLLDLAQELSVSAGVSRAFPFELALPADAVPTTRTPHTHMTWMVSTIGVTKVLKANQIVHVTLHVHRN
jgi:hypothetical protein